MAAHPESGPAVCRLRLVIRGAVQGVGFRPFVYRLARELDLRGWVANTSAGVHVEVEGPETGLTVFQARLRDEAPPRAVIQSCEASLLEPRGMDRFEIRRSDAGGKPSVLVLPDIATCPACLGEIRDPSNRRYRYPFTNCTHCGPRFSIIQALPYDRRHTTMRGFTMCPACRAEYEDPADRRFHAQPNACPRCGPQLAWWDGEGRPETAGEEALGRALEVLRGGGIVAVKGLGGFHLMVDAADAVAVERLRRRKRREEKPLAVMCPSLAAVRELCDVAPPEQRLLTSPEAPIVLLRRRPSAALADAVAPGNPRLGVMLPYTPLHHLLTADFGGTLVATSGNLSEEPICIDETEASRRLAGMADGFLVHDRPIARHVDDSVARVLLGREQILRRARGYAPLPVRLPRPVDGILAVGGHLKNAVGLGVGHDLFISQHIGDLDTAGSLAAFRAVTRDLQDLFRRDPVRVACDAHPDYASTRVARTLSVPVSPVQHHLAHIAGCLAENDAAPPALGLSWDGTGYGTDGTVWGGEFLLLEADGGWRRFAHLRTFPLPGGEAAVREPRRSALGLLLEMGALDRAERLALSVLAAFSPEERRVLETTAAGGLNAPRTSSLGRLFDAVAALLGIRVRAAYEGQAAMMLEWLADPDVAEAYPFEVVEADTGRAMRGAGPAGVAASGAGPLPFVYDWGPMIEAMLTGLADRLSPAVIAACFHQALVEMGVDAARRAGLERVVLSGGCFQNALLTERLVERLRAEGFRPCWHQRVPPNDGGIALGQAAAVAFRCHTGA